LEKGKYYYGYSKLAKDLVKKNAASVRIFSETTPDFYKESLLCCGAQRRGLFIHSGGYGDTITVGILLPLLEEKFGIAFDISCHYDKWHYVLKPMGFEGGWIPYPIDLESLDNYDCLLTSITQYVTEPMRLLRESPLEVVAESFGLSLSRMKFNFTIPEEEKTRARLPKGNAIRLGLNFDSMGAIKSYPLDLQPVLAQSLLALGFDLFLFGTAPVCKEVPFAHTHLHDFTGKTSILELAALLEQMDFVLAADSFVAHLAALLGKKTMVLLSTTIDAYFKHYAHVQALNSKMPCAPCFQTGDQCPQGLSQCGAFYDPSLHPDRIVSRMIQEITTQYRRRLM
jgi:hypothetical protein